MSILRSRILPATLVLVCVFVSLSSAQDNDKQKLAEQERCKQWELAAWNREMAAGSQEAQADSLLAVGQELRRRGYVDDPEKRAFLRSAGEVETKAGDLLAAAVGNLDKAAACWDKAASGHRRLSDDEKYDKARKMTAAARRNAVRVCAAAADAYERAAEVYGAGEGDELVKAAVASEKAAQWREILATRR